jgi:GT2 family glycosyltransferase
VSWSVVHADLRAGTSPQPTGESPSFVVWWWGALPLGTTSHLAVELPLGRDQLRDLAARLAAQQMTARLATFGGVPGAAADGDPARPLRISSVRGDVDFEAFDRWALPSSATAEGLSIVVCTRDRPQALRSCLRALQAQRAPAGELIVIDNSADATAADVVNEFAGVVFVHEPRPGLSVARNAGIRHCTRPLLAFTDDDVEVDVHWTAETVDAFARDPGADAVCGIVVPAVLNTEAQRFFQFDLGGFGSRYVPVRFDRRFLDANLAVGPQVWRIGAGANMAFRREVFDRVGHFDERLGAGASGCSEDSELWYRIIAAGGACLYEPRVMVRHHHRADWPGLRQQLRAYMKGHTAALLIQHERYGHPGNARRAFLQLPRYFLRCAGQVVTGRYPRPVSILLAEFRGWLEGVLFALRRRGDA